MSKSKCEWKKLGEVCEIKNGKQLDKKNMINGTYKVYGGGMKVGYHNKYNREKNHIIISATGILVVLLLSQMKIFGRHNVLQLKLKLCE